MPEYVDAATILAHHRALVTFFNENGGITHCPASSVLDDPEVTDEVIRAGLDRRGLTGVSTDQFREWLNRCGPDTGLFLGNDDRMFLITTAYRKLQILEVRQGDQSTIILMADQ